MPTSPSVNPRPDFSLDFHKRRDDLFEAIRRLGSYRTALSGYAGGNTAAAGTAAMTGAGNLSALSIEAREHVRKDARRIAFKSRLPEIAEDLEIEGIATYGRRSAGDPFDVDSQGTDRNRAWNAMWNLARRKMRRRFHGSVDLMASYRLHEEGRSFTGVERPDLDLLEEVISALPDRGRRIARAVLIQNITQEVVAAEMGISQGTVSRCLNQCIPVIAQKYLERSA